MNPFYGKTQWHQQLLWQWADENINDDRAAIKLLREEKGCGAKRILLEFSNKQWSRTAVTMFLRKIDQTSSVSCKEGSGRPRSVRTEANIDLVADLICSQENDPGTGKSQREIEKETRISRSSVCRFAWHDLQLKVFKRKKRTCCLTLIEKPVCSAVAYFCELEAGSQNLVFRRENFYCTATHEHTERQALWHCRGEIGGSIHAAGERPQTFQWTRYSVGGCFEVRKNWCTFCWQRNKGWRCILQRHFAEGMLVARYQMQHVFQQDGAPSHRAKLTVEFQQRNVPDFIEPGQRTAQIWTRWTMPCGVRCSRWFTGTASPA